MNIFSKVNKIYFSEYHLAPLKKLNSKADLTLKKGYLLKIDFKNLGHGYCDLFTWPELGDLQSAEQLKNLKTRKLNDQLLKCLYFSYLDAQFRAKNENIFKKTIFPKNHLTIVDFTDLNEELIHEIKQQRFTKVKIKLGLNVLEMQQKLSNVFELLFANKINIRIDFNNSLNNELFLKFLEKIYQYINIVDFIEDPYPYFYKDYSAIKKRFPTINVALDRFSEIQISSINELKADFLIVKPVIQNFNYEKFNSKLVFTSYMDHPLGQLCAIYEAANFFAQHNKFVESECGFLTHTLYEKNKYSETFSLQETRLIPTIEGTGFGFDEYLSNENWKELI